LTTGGDRGDFDLILVTDDGHIYLTPDLADSFQLEEAYADDYTWRCTMMKHLRSTRFWLGAFAVAAAAERRSMSFSRARAGGGTAVILQDNEVIRRIDLSAVTEPYSLRIDNSSGGYNIVLVEKGRISVTEASCPDKICIHQGKISDSLKPIVCLPNGL
jgi:hypothetical protein